MKKSLLSLAAIALLTGTAYGAPNSSVIESYTANTTIVFSNNTVGQIVVDNLNFEAGAVMLGLEAIDLDGQESEFAGMSAKFASDAAPSQAASINSLTAPTAVPAMHVGQGTSALDSGESATVNFSGSGAFDLSQLRVGDTFVGSGSFANLQGVSTTLGESRLTYASTYTITQVDVANGLVRASCAGDVSALRLIEVPHDDDIIPIDEGPFLDQP